MTKRAKPIIADACDVAWYIRDRTGGQFRHVTAGPPQNIRDKSRNGPHVFQFVRCNGTQLIYPIAVCDEDTEMSYGVNGCRKVSIVRPGIHGTGKPTRHTAWEMTVDADADENGNPVHSFGCKIDLTGCKLSVPYRVVNFASGTGHYLMLNAETEIDSPEEFPIAVDPGYGTPVGVTIIGATPEMKERIFVHPTCKNTVIFGEHL
jgi:hypothetical protein